MKIQHKKYKIRGNTAKKAVFLCPNGGVMVPKQKKFWEFRLKNAAKSAQNSDETIGELLLYGEIADSTWWGDEVTPKQFKADLDGLGDISTLNVYINSPGGDCFAGQAIYSILNRCKATKNVYIDGLAASMASVVACVGDKVIMPCNAMMMIHNPWTIAMGNSNDFREMADTLDKIRESSLAVYAKKTGMKDDELIPLLDAETWMTADDAKKLGFCDEIEDCQKVAASIMDDTLVFNGVNMPLNRFKHFPTSKMQFYHPVKQGVVPPNVSTNTADEDTPWNKPELGDFTDKSWPDLTDDEKEKIAGHYAWSNVMPPEIFGDLKFPHHQPSDGKVVWDGVANCVARLDQADIPSEDIPKVQAHLGDHYHQFGKTPPWEEGGDDEDSGTQESVKPPDNQANPVEIYAKLLKINERRSSL
jgi:ATP-dependent Clp endopeptidase proteolytic subunit ClpP